RVNCESRMFSAIENCWRIEAADSKVAERAKVGSFSTMPIDPPKPSSRRNQAMVLPMIAPPTIRMSKLCMRSSEPGRQSQATFSFPRQEVPLRGDQGPHQSSDDGRTGRDGGRHDR